MKGFVFIAGPYRGQAQYYDHRSYSEIDKNIATARDWAVRMARDGIEYFCPHLNSAHMEVIAPDVPADYWLSLDLGILQHAWAIFLLPGWRNSKGTLGEVNFAANNNIPIFNHTAYDQLEQMYRRSQ